MEPTLNKLLNGRISILQPQEGYRTAIDPIFLAATLKPHPQDHVLEVGAGVGTAMLCLASRVSDCYITGLELQSELVDLGIKNILNNKFEKHLKLIQGDLLTPPASLMTGRFNHVMANPPYLAGNLASASRHSGKALAHHEGNVSLKDWIDFCLKMLIPKGSITLIHRADRLDSILAALNGKVGEITVFPLWPKQNKPAKRILIQGRKGISSPSCLEQGMILHQEDGRYTTQAEAILRYGYSLHNALLLKVKNLDINVNR
ncbi:MAG: methyltransferase [Alphaproteobacteria bacterium]|nr:methyltransferase [Alphaproteobacteria bacterium]